MTRKTASCRSNVQSSDFVAELEAANLHPLWDRFRAHAGQAAGQGPAVHLALARHRAVHRTAPVGEVPIDDVERRALILVHPGVRRRDHRPPAT